MALNFDHRSAPIRPSQLLALAEAIHGAGPADESVWLEWKSTLALNSKAGCHHIARAIVGFANRMPDVASGYTEGHAYLVVGVEPGNLVGVEPIDVVDLDQGLAPYLGDQPLRWRPTYVSITRGDRTAHVLIVDVEPPRWGDEIFCLCKEYNGVRDGAIFVRGNGSTRPAATSEVKALGLRQKRSVQSIEVDVRVLAGTPVRPVDAGPLAVEGWLAGRRRAALASLQAHERPKASGRRSSLSGAEYQAMKQSLSRAMEQSIGRIMKSEPETRTAAEYRAEVEQYVLECAGSWAEAVLPAAAVHIKPVELELVNLLSANLAAVEVQLYIPGEVEAVVPRQSRALEAGEGFVRLPKAPRPYGPHQRELFGELSHSSPLSPRVSFGLSGHMAPLRPTIDNGGSTTITFSPVHLRAEQRLQLDPIVVIVRTPAPARLVCRWQATSTNMDGRLTGELVLEVSEDVVVLVARSTSSRLR
ncbi:AlbA family DNA-binding domain-containing protein [Nonomuraea soli]|uniref:Uncharacterized protein n=1 Tax=Nonomuraea soli TaxID=1032476 RepID=A0A7W0CVA9_9ACTN|nr:ATP-binding protein [Nonomuraea soli]MBA2897779.1 hypothetical protein [Nonomuraea soli]